MNAAKHNLPPTKPIAAATILSDLNPFSPKDEFLLEPDETQRRLFA